MKSRMNYWKRVCNIVQGNFLKRFSKLKAMKVKDLNYSQMLAVKNSMITIVVRCQISLTLKGKLQEDVEIS